MQAATALRRRIPVLTLDVAFLWPLESTVRLQVLIGCAQHQGVFDFPRRQAKRRPCRIENAVVRRFSEERRNLFVSEPGNAAADARYLELLFGMLCRIFQEDSDTLFDRFQFARTKCF